jgi:hypothetical protein
MAPAKLKSHLYLKAVKYLAAESPETLGPLETLPLAESLPVRLCAHLWDRPALNVARDILDSRQKA